MVRGSVEETLNELLEQEAENMKMLPFSLRLPSTKMDIAGY